MDNKFTARVTSAKNKSYYGMASESVSTAGESFLESWINSSPEHPIFHSNKIERDGTPNLHITVLTPVETRTLRKRGVNLDREFSQEFQVEFLGVGVVREEDNESWFIVAESPEVQTLRKSFGLAYHDLHATLGFRDRDIFSSPKNSLTIV